MSEAKEKGASSSPESQFPARVEAGPGAMEPSVAEWVLDLGVVVHATGDLQLLQDYDRNQGWTEHISVGNLMMDNQFLPVRGWGSVKTDKIEVPNVRYVQGLTVNVIAVGQLVREHPLEVNFQHPRGDCYIRKSGGQIVGRGARSRDGRYLLEYLRVGLEYMGGPLDFRGPGRSPLSPPRAGPDDDDDDGSQPQAGPDPDSCVGSDIVEAGPGASAPSVDEWVLDTSGRTLYHETGNLLLLRDGRNLITYDLQELADAPPPGGDDRGLHILGCGSVKTDRIVVPNVRYVQGATENIISVAQLSREHSLVVVFEPKYCYIRKSGGQMVGRARLRTGRYVLEYLHVGLEDDASLKMPTGTGDDDDDDHDGSQPQAGPDPDSWFGLSLSDIPTVNSCCDHVCTGRFTLLTSTGTPSQHFYMDSGAYCHSTGDPSVLQRYPDYLNVKAPIESLGGFVNGPSVRVDGCGYVNRDGVMQLDGVLRIPGSSANVVSVGQLAKQYGVRTVFENEFFRVETLQQNVTIGHGHREKGGNQYILDRFLPGALFVHSQTDTQRSDMFGNVKFPQQPS